MRRLQQVSAVINHMGALANKFPEKPILVAWPPPAPAALYEDLPNLALSLELLRRPYLDFADQDPDPKSALTAVTQVGRLHLVSLLKVYIGT